MTYIGNWYSNNYSANSGGSAVLALDRGARATFTFNGIAAKWIGHRDAWSGIANVYIDGVLKAQIDAYAATDQAQAVLFTITGLTSGSHTLTIEATQTKSAPAQSAWLWVDGFEFAQ